MREDNPRVVRRRDRHPSRTRDHGGSKTLQPTANSAAAAGRRGYRGDGGMGRFLGRWADHHVGTSGGAEKENRRLSARWRGRQAALSASRALLGEDGGRSRTRGTAPVGFGHGRR